ncbi:hypothetical protein [Streptomyces beihaiensis]|uniref:Lipoprotein n=1 Tax=Streptomyces beihaiensis TaxID=2984495 RepID=A0ABT3U3X2_9ACTN|nr:hypothetical protein [Streptomyces beihaiensis]MCX3064029.1 hypothetical protein [Streptomyces beihaiensis]
MRRPALAAAAATLAALALTGPAHADGQPPDDPPLGEQQPSFSVTPDPAVPGSSVTVSVSGGCTARSATATSSAFAEKVELSTGSAGIYTGTADIRKTAVTGTATVTVTCGDGGTSTYDMKVRADGDGGRRRPDDHRPAGTLPKGVQAGVGPDHDRTTVGDAVQLGLGGLLMAGATVSGVVYTVRRRAWR